LVKGAAWAVPAVTIAAAAPTAAASVLCTGTFCLTSDFCKLPGASTGCVKGYRAPASIQAVNFERILVAKVTAQGLSTAENADLVLQIIPTSGQVSTCSAGCSCTVTVPAGYMKICIPASVAPLQYDIQVCNFGNSASTTITLDYFMYKCSGTGACLLLETAKTSGGSHPC
jgi:hypothetical protein